VPPNLPNPECSSSIEYPASSIQYPPPGFCGILKPTMAELSGRQRGILGVVCVLVIGVYAYTARSGFLESLGRPPADSGYNLLVRGFRAGQLSLKLNVPPGLQQLADPYDPTANALYRSKYGLHDLSYYQGRFYLYFGLTPALILLWPFVVLTGHYLLDKTAVVIFCAIGFLASAGLLCALWRRYFAEVSVGVVAACALALGLATGVPVMLSRCDVYEVAISCGYMLVMLALGGIWCALHAPEHRGRWLAAASVAYGLALGARPSLLFGAVILLVPVIQAWREPRKVSRLLAATGPITLIGLGLMVYNALRFHNPLEFGVRYQLSAVRQFSWQLFSPRFLPVNFRALFLEPARWSSQFPFVQDIPMRSGPAGYGTAEKAFGVLTNTPLVWLALAVPLAWRGAASLLRWFVIAVSLVFATCAVTLCLLCGANVRYEVEFLPALLLLAAVGILGLERALAPTSRSGLAPTSESGQTRPLIWRDVGRSIWCLLLGFSVAFNLLVCVVRAAEAHNDMAVALLQSGKAREAIGHFEQALWLKPDLAEADYNLGVALEQTGRRQEAMRHFEQALSLNPNFAEAQSHRELALNKVGRGQQLAGPSGQTSQTNSDYAEVYNNLGNALAHENRFAEAARYYEQAVRLRPDYAEAHNNLALALLELGRTEDAIDQWQQALRVKPDMIEAHSGLALAFMRLGKLPEAIGHWEQMLRIKPDSTGHYKVGLALWLEGNRQKAIEHYREALRLKPDYIEAHFSLGLALEQTGRFREAIKQYEQTVQIKPDYAEAQNNLAWLLATLGPADGGDPARAVVVAQRACELTGNRVAPYLDTLAAAYAAAGRFSDAVDTAQKGVELAQAAGQPHVASEIGTRLALYRGGHAYRLLGTPVQNLPATPLRDGSGQATSPDNS